MVFSRRRFLCASHRDSRAVTRTLHRSIYGLKQAARVWNMKIDDVLKTMGFIQSMADPCLYIRKKAGKSIFVLIYVHDVIVICNTEEEFSEVVHVLTLHFTISVMSNLRFFSWHTCLA